MDSLYEVSLSLTIQTYEKRKRVPLGKVLSTEMLSSVRDASIAYGFVPDTFPLSAYEKSSVSVRYAETKDRTIKGGVVAVDKDRAAAAAINNLIVVSIEKMSSSMKSIKSVSVKRVKKTRSAVAESYKSWVVEQIEAVNLQPYNTKMANATLDILSWDTPYKYVDNGSGYTYLALNDPGNPNTYSYHTSTAIEFLKMGLLTTSLNLTMEEINIQSALGVDIKKLFKSGSLSWNDKMLSLYDIKRPVKRAVKRAVV